MGECAEWQDFKNGRDGGQELFERTGNALSGAHRLSLSGLCGITGGAQDSHEHRRLGEASGRLLEFNGNELLTGPGKISAEQAKLHEETEYEKYRIIQDRLYESDFDRFLMLEQEVNHKP